MTLTPEQHDQEPDTFIYPAGLATTPDNWYLCLLTLNLLLGRQSVSTLAGRHDTSAVDSWLFGSQVPTDAEKRRIVAALEWLDFVAESTDSLDLAKAWFIGRNTDGHPAYVAISQDMFHLVEESANEYVQSRTP